jgi:hypothetical protein
MPTNQKSGRPPRLEFPLEEAKILFDNVIKKFEKSPEAALLKKKQRREEERFDALATVIAKSILLKECKTEEEIAQIEQKEPVQFLQFNSVLLKLHTQLSKQKGEAIVSKNGKVYVKISETLLHRLKIYIDDTSEISVAAPSTKISSFIGKYTCHYKTDRLIDNKPFLREAQLEIREDGTILFYKDDTTYQGKQPKIVSLNLFVTVASPKTIFHLVVKIGMNTETKLPLMTGILTGTNQDSNPVSFVVLLVRADWEKKENIHIETFFERFGKTILRTSNIDGLQEQLLSLPRKAIDDELMRLFLGNWYIYHREKKEEVYIRRGKISILNASSIVYEGTQHQYNTGAIELIGDSCISIELTTNDKSKILKLVGKLTSKSKFKEKKQLKCLFISSSAQGGTVMKAGSCLLVKPQGDIPFSEMTAAEIKKGGEEYRTLEKEYWWKNLPENNDIEENGVCM